MKLSIDGVVTDMQPDSLTWSPPSIMGRTGLGAPILSPSWACSLGFGRLTVAQYHSWFDVWDGELHYVSLPHPKNGLVIDYECYVDTVSTRLNTRDVCKAAASGVDIALSRVLVER